MSLVSWLRSLFGRPSPLELSPSDWMKLEGITWYETTGKVEIDLSRVVVRLSKPPKVWIPPVPKYKDPSKGSMLPNFSHEHNNILIAGSTKTDHAKIVGHLQVGDIAVYRIMTNPKDDPADFTKAHVAGGYAIHRIIKIDTDNQGKYFQFKGDNNPVADRFRVRDFNILWVSIGTIF